MIIDTGNNEIRSDDGKIKLATINSLTIYRGDKKEYESTTETEIVEIDTNDQSVLNSFFKLHFLAIFLKHNSKKDRKEFKLKLYLLKDKKKVKRIKKKLSQCINKNIDTKHIREKINEMFKIIGEQ